MKNNNVKEMVGLVIWRLQAITECAPPLVQGSLADTIKILKHILSLSKR